MYKFKSKQISFTDFNTPIGMKLNPDNRWVKKAEMIPWDEIEQRYAKLFTNRKGNVAKPLRLALRACEARICTCQTPCTESPYGKCTYTYPDRDFRMYPGVPRNTEHWDNLYNHRVYIERTIFLLKDCFGLNTLRTQNTTTIKADVYLAAITQLIGVILAKSIHELKLFKSVRKLVKQVA